MGTGSAPGRPGAAADDLDAPADGPWTEAWKRLRRNRMAMAGLVVVLLMAAAAVLAPWLVPFDPRESFRFATSAPPGARHLDLRNEVVLEAGKRPRDGDVPESVLAVLRDGRKATYELDVLDEKVRLLRLTMDGGKILTVGEGAVRHKRLERGEHGRFLLQENGRALDAEFLEPGGGLPASVPTKTGRWALLVELRVRAPDARRTVTAVFDAGTGVVGSLLSAGQAVQGELRIRGEDVTDTRLDGVRHERVHLLGTDLAGRDLFSRIVYGGRISLLVGLVATVVSLTVGTLWGAAAGFLGGRADAIMMRIVDVLYALPYIFLVIVLLTVFERSLLMLFVALGLVQWLTPARVVRGQILSLRKREFVEAAVTVGTRPHAIVLRHLVPNSLGIVIVFTTLTIPAVIMEESFLSFIGLTVLYDGDPLDSWGALVENGRSALGVGGERWWMLAFPALAMSVTLFSLNFLGDGLRDALDPRQKGRA